jgi:hypothetical protein
MNMDADERDLLADDGLPEAIEGYCVRCREMVEIDDPAAVWTRKGMPATRGDCPICGGTVFRMGMTDAHRSKQRPSAVEIDEGERKRKQPVLAKDTVYVNFAAADSDLAARVADDLINAGVAAWLHEVDDVQWANGVHPALQSCNRMVYVLSEAALGDPDVEAAWKFFREKRKPIVIAQVGDIAPPDAIRRSPRFDLTAQYRTAFRAILRALTD